MREIPQLDAQAVAHGDKVYAHRLGNLAAIDGMVSSLINKLSDKGLLDNTYILYTTDNGKADLILRKTGRLTEIVGFHINQHRLPPGKRCPYEEDINIPLLVR